MTGEGNMNHIPFKKVPDIVVIKLDLLGHVQETRSSKPTSQKDTTSGDGVSGYDGGSESG
jgi:hypothetical protein